MSAEALLSRLEKARQTGRGSWVACCPAHDDKKPSLAIRELDDGRVLTHCFAGCGFDEIVSAAGVNIEDLFPQKTLHAGAKPIRRPYPAADVLACIAFEVTIAQIAACDMTRGVVLSDIDKARLALAAERLRSAAEIANGKN